MGAEIVVEDGKVVGSENKPMEQHIVIGKIVAPHGVRGEFRIMPQTDHPERYAKMKKITLTMAGNIRWSAFVSTRMYT